MYKLIVKILVEIFIKKKNRMRVKYMLLGLPNKLRVLTKAKKVGKGISCGTDKIRVNKHTVIGNNVGFNGLIIWGDGDVIIGNNVIIASECIICSDNHNYNGTALPFDNTVIRKTVEIGDNVWIGVRCTILPGTKIGEGAIIQAGAVVHGEIPPCSIAGGNPAKVFKYRDVEHYNRIKAEMERKNANIQGI